VETCYVNGVERERCAGCAVLQSQCSATQKAGATTTKRHLGKSPEGAGKRHATAYLTVIRWAVHCFWTIPHASSPRAGILPRQSCRIGPWDGMGCLQLARIFRPQNSPSKKDTVRGPQGLHPLPPLVPVRHSDVRLMRRQNYTWAVDASVCVG